MCPVMASLSLSNTSCTRHVGNDVREDVVLHFPYGTPNPNMGIVSDTPVPRCESSFLSLHFPAVIGVVQRE
ncbi:hypothetical protein HBI64_124760 [Parastagonospora nodorum]|nr:hypothetical protein HBH50_158470 [Parastagonospora nodorum]KAH4092074.1 hypothetical protein HBH48_081530 [Parastagonospora nodorum]KAH6128346.1 hypothetical protein HBI64_124760 [Parastagonospora nodorum]